MTQSGVALDPVAYEVRMRAYSAADNCVNGNSAESATVTSAAVLPINQAPTVAIEIANYWVTVGASQAVDVSSTFNDPENETLTFTAISSDTSKATVAVDDSTGTLTVTGVAAGSATVTVTATDPGGLSAQDSFEVTVIDVPAKPVNFAAAAGDSQVALSWTNPGDATITKYQLRFGAGATVPPAETWADIDGSGAATTSHTVTGLANGTQYAFEIRAVSASGDSEASDMATATPVLAIPKAPTSLGATSSHNSAKLNWSLPTNASEIDAVQVRWKATANLPFDNAADTWTNLPGTATNYKAGGLSNGTEYTFAVRANNSAGNGAEATATATPQAEAVVQVSKTNLEVVEGGSDTFDVSLAGEPTGPVTVAVNSDDADVTVTPATLTFTVLNYSAPQTVTVGMAANPTDGNAKLSLTASGGGYDDSTAEVFVTSDALPSFGTATIADQDFALRTAITALTLPEATGGDGALTYTLSPAAPAGLTFDATARTLAGTPTVPQVATEYTYTATDTDGDSAELKFDIRVAAFFSVGEVNDADQPENSAYSAAAVLKGTPVGNVTWALTGDDGSTFALTNATNTGVTVGLAAQDFESPADQNADNVYQYTLTATDDDNNTAAADASITITDVIETAVLALTGLADGDVDEDSDFTATAALANAIGAVTWTLGGDDADDFTLSNTGATAATVTLASPDYENPTDANADNVYHYTLTATDADGNTVTSNTIVVTVNDINETPLAKPRFTGATGSADEVTLVWEDPDDSSITKYQLRYRLPKDLPFDDSAGWHDIPDSGSTTTRYSVTGLLKGMYYSAQIRAVNSSGIGPASDPITMWLPPVLQTPTGLSAEAGDGKVTLSWANPGNSAIIKYQFRYDKSDFPYLQTPWIDIPGSGPTTTTYTKDNMTNGVKIYFQIRAVDSSGASGNTTSVSATPGQLVSPAKPRFTGATGSADEVTLVWEDPDDNSITKYQLRYRLPKDLPFDDSAGWHDIPDSGSTTTRYSVTGLLKGMYYSAQIRAVNSSGIGPASDPITMWLPPVLQTPTGLSAEAGDGKVTLSWANPGNSAIIKYQFRYDKSDFPYLQTPWIDIPGSGPTTTTYTKDNMTNGVKIYFQIRAVDSSGASGNTTSVSATPGQSVSPAKPTGLTAVADLTSVQLTWTDPEDSSITQYQYRRKAGSSFPSGDPTPWKDAGDLSTNSFGVSGLTHGTQYVFQIRAVNSHGYGTPSDAVTATLKPAKMEGISATPGDERVTLNWTDSGDASITKYQYTRNTGSIAAYSWIDIPVSGAGDNTYTYTITGLTNGRRYSFVMRAVNASGEGAPSKVYSATPGSPPTARPTGLTAVADLDSVTLVWADPGDATIAKYQYRYKVGSDFPTTDPTEWKGFASNASTTSKVLGGLIKGTQYVFQIRTEGPGGWSAPSDAVTASLKPAKPSGLTAEPGPNLVQLAWTDSGDSTITSYQYRVKPGSNFPTDDLTEWKDVVGLSMTSFGVGGLAHGTQYVFQVRTVSAHGYGAPSDAVTATLKPARVEEFTATAGDGQVTLDWTDLGDASITKLQYQNRSNATGLGDWVDIPNSGAGSGTYSYTITGLTNGIQSVFSIRAVNASGIGESSYGKPTTPGSPPPAKPTGLTAVGNYSTIGVHWTKIDDLRYQYRHKAGSDFPIGDPTEWEYVSENSSAFSVANLTLGTQYVFQVRAASSSGWSAPSDSVTAMLKPAKPAGVSARAGDGQVTLSWIETGDASITKHQYRRWTDTGAGTSWIDIPRSGAGNSNNSYVFAVTGLTNGTEYTFEMRAVNASGESQSSDEMTATPGSLPPAKPMDLIAGAGNGFVRLLWTDPSDATIMGYEYRIKVGLFFQPGDPTPWKTFPSNASTKSVEIPLTNRGQYVFQIRAFNTHGHSARSNMARVPLLVQPTKPTEFSATSGDGLVTLNWTDPGDESIIKYQYRQWAGTGANTGWRDIPQSSAGTTSYKISGLTNGTEYRFKIRAVNADGIGASSNNATATPSLPPPPRAPLGLTAVAGHERATLNWTDPDDASITKYQFRQSVGTGAGAGWADIPDSGAETTIYTVTELTNGTEHRFEIRAVNVGGNSDSSNEVAATPALPPLPRAPSGLSAEMSDSGLLFKWKDPGDITITKYQFRSKEGSSFTDNDPAQWRDVPWSGPHTVYFRVPDLIDGTQYVVQFRAVNPGGYGTASEAVTFTASPPPPLPQAPTGLSAEVGDGRITITWDDPGDDTISKYRIRRIEGQRFLNGDTTAWNDILDSGPTTTTHTVTGLTNGKHYAIQILASNSLGHGGLAEISAVPRPPAPTSPPEKPAGLVAEAGYGEVTLSWTNPGDPSITKYRYKQRIGTGAATGWKDIPDSEAGTTSYRVSGLTNDAEHQFRIRAVNAAGNSPRSTWVTATPITPPLPKAPSGLTSEVGDGRVTFTWADPGDDTITKYQVRSKQKQAFYIEDDDEPWNDIVGSGASTTSYAVSGLTNGTLYAFQFRAVNSAGYSVPSISPTVTPSPPAPPTPPDKPEKPTGLVASAGDGEVTLTWTDPGDLSITKYRYRQRIGTVTEAWKDIPDSDAGTTSYTFSGLTNGTQHQFRIRAVNAAGNGSTSSWLTATPVAPTSLLSVANAQAQEGPGVTLDFTVTLTPAVSSAVTVDYTTSDGTALAGQDYTAAIGTLTFAAGETTKTVSVAVIDDVIDEVDETFSLVLLSATGAGIDTAAATGTIANTDPLPAAWLTRFGRAVAGHVVDGISERLLRTESQTPHISIAGMRMDFGSEAGDVPPERLLAAAGWSMGVGGHPSMAGHPSMNRAWTGPFAAHSPGAGAFAGQTGAGQMLPGSGPVGLGASAGGPASPARQTHLGDMLMNSSFAFSAGGEEGAAPAWDFWGQGSGTRFDGNTDGVRVDGDVRTYLMGADTTLGRWLAGAALSLSSGAGGYEAAPRPGADGPQRGMLTSALTGIHPYARYAVNDRLSAWGTAGLATGETTLDREDAGRWTVDTSMQMAAAGLRGVLREAGPDNGVELAVRADAMWTAIESDGATTEAGRLAAATGTSSRTRLILEASKAFALANGRSLTPTLELGARHDGGDAEVGAGVELGGGLRFTDPSLGLDLELKARSLLSHQDANYREWGASASLRFDPGIAGRGLRLELAPSWGAADAGGTERLWSQSGVSDLFGTQRQLGGAGRLDAELGYAMDGPRGRGMQTPFAALSRTQFGERAIRLGWRLDIGPLNRVSIEALLRQPALGGPPERGFAAQATWTW